MTAVVPPTASAAEVERWLSTTDEGVFKEFAEDDEKLKGLNGRLLHEFSKADLKDICGGNRGAALYNRLHPRGSGSGGGGGGGGGGAAAGGAGEDEAAEVAVQVEAMRLEGKRYDYLGKQADLERVRLESKPPSETTTSVPDPVFYDSIESSIATLASTDLPCATAAPPAGWVDDLRRAIRACPVGTSEEDVQANVTQFFSRRVDRRTGKLPEPFLQPVDTHAADVLRGGDWGNRRPDHTFVSRNAPWNGVAWHDAACSLASIALLGELKKAGNVSGNSVSRDDMGRFIATAQLLLRLQPTRTCVWAYLTDLHAIRVLRVQRAGVEVKWQYAMSDPQPLIDGTSVAAGGLVLYNLLRCSDAELGLDLPRPTWSTGTPIVLDRVLGKGATGTVFVARADTHAEGKESETAVADARVAAADRIVVKTFKTTATCDRERRLLARVVGISGVPQVLHSADNMLVLVPCAWGGKVGLCGAGFLASLIDVLERVHAKRLAHGDIRRSNVLEMSSGTPLLVDFSHAGDFGNACSADRRVDAVVDALVAATELTRAEAMSSTTQSAARDLVQLGILVFFRLKEWRRPSSTPDWGAVFRRSAPLCALFAAAARGDHKEVKTQVASLVMED